MRLGIVGKKVGMTQIFDSAGALVPVTVVDTTDCYIVQVKNKEKDGYSAIQVGFGPRKLQNVKKAAVGHYKKASVPARANLKEIRLEDGADLSQFKPGVKLSCGMFAKGDQVDVIGITKGKGFTGVFKRFGFHGAPASHGASKYFRHGGSNGTNTFPGKTLKHKGMPGHVGNAIRTQQNLSIIDVVATENLLLLKGAIPGPSNGLVMVRTSRKAKTLPKERAWVAAG